LLLRFLAHVVSCVVLPDPGGPSSLVFLVMIAPHSLLYIFLQYLELIIWK